jgi:flagellar protein FliO/FliZ
MDILSLLRTLGGLGIVLGLLAGGLWVVRRYDIRLPGRIGGGPARRLELVERLTVDAKRSVALIRRDGCEHLIFIDPSGAVVVETGIPCSLPDHEDVVIEGDEAASPRPFSAAQPIPFRDVLQRVQGRIRRTRTQGEVDATDAGAEQING